MDIKRIQVDIGQGGYPVFVGRGILQRSGRLFSSLGLQTSPVVIADAAVLRLHGDALVQSLRRSLGDPMVIPIAGGEGAKNHRSLLRIYDALLNRRADRDSWIVTFGGGVLTDLAGFAAATYLRGIRYVNVATTLLAQIDSAIGGKVGINVPQGKNLVGAFHQPAAVLCDVGILSTLPRRQLAAGVYEAIKCAAIRSAPLATWIEANLAGVLAGKAEDLTHLVFEAASIKAKVVGRDERDQAGRIVLNFGHTVGHALEAATGFERFTHGEAVGLGMVAALDLGVQLGITPTGCERRLSGLIHRVGPLPGFEGIELSELWDAFEHDKKHRDGQLTMVFLARTGATKVLRSLDIRRLRRFLDGFLSAGVGRRKKR